jgi:endonuclease/exonuclease/phosphatase family metal-dependent hydrolase
MRAVALLALLCLVPPPAPGEEGRKPPDPEPLRVLSFNIRYANPEDGDNRWQRRRGLVVETILTFDPDLLGLQEVLYAQGQFLRDKLTGYGFVGVGREDGKRKGELCPILYRKRRFTLLSSGHYWLSEKPAKPGSKSWDSSQPRMVTWVELRDGKGGTALHHANTHWDHQGKKARRESAKLMRRRLRKLQGDRAIVVTGDFNTTETSLAYRLLTEGESERKEGFRLVDGFRQVHPERGPEEATYHGFKGGRKGLRIDWVLHTPRLRTVEASIDRTNRKGRFPSDHYPVRAVLERVKEK